jgi:hypothetical protein
MLRKLFPLAAVACALATVACGSSSSLNTNKLEQQIQRRLKAVGIRLKRISCPKSRSLRRGDSFECHAIARNGARLTVAVTQTSSKGNASWDVTSGIVDVAMVRKDIENDFANVKPPDKPINVNVDCGLPDTIAANDGDTFNCQVSNRDNPSDTTTVKVTVNSNSQTGRSFDWQPATSG